MADIETSNVTPTGTWNYTGATLTAKGASFTFIKDGTDGELLTWDANGVIATVAVGTATQVLTSNGTGAAPTFQAAGGGNLVLVEHKDVGSDTTSVTFSSLDINTDGKYLLILEVLEAGVNTSTISLYVNGLTTATDYQSQRLQASGTGTSASRDNNARIMVIDVNDTGLATIWISLINGYYYASSIGPTDQANIRYDNFAVRKDATVANITSLVIEGNETNGIDGNSKMTLYKLTES